MKSLNQIGSEFVEHSGVRCTLEQHIERAREEFNELLEAIVDDYALACNNVAENQRLRNHVGEEAADVIITLAVMCAQHSIDLDAAIVRKADICMRRQWVPHPIIPGAVKGIKLPEEKK